MMGNLKRLDLQLIIDRIRKMFIEYETAPYMKHVAAKKHIVKGALNRNKKFPDGSSWPLTQI